MFELNNRESQIYKVKSKYNTLNSKKTIADLDDPNLLQDDDYLIDGSFGIIDFTHTYSIPEEVKESLGSLLF